MVNDILNFISLGRNLIHAVQELRRIVPSRSSDTALSVASGQIGALDARIGEIELRSNQQYFRIVEIEQSLKRAVQATEALAQRMSTIFWVSVVGCGFGLIALIVSAVALRSTVH